MRSKCRPFVPVLPLLLLAACAAVPAPPARVRQAAGEALFNCLTVAPRMTALRRSCRTAAAEFCRNHGESPDCAEDALWGR